MQCDAMILYRVFRCQTEKLAGDLGGREMTSNHKAK